MTEKIVQTAGREQLGEFAPDFAHFNDDILFGENWNNTDIDVKTRSIITVVALMSQGVTDNSIRYHIQNAKNHGVSQREMAAVITHVAFYAGWPHAWAVFNIAKEIYAGNAPAVSEKDKFQSEIMFPIGEPNPYGDYFVGQSYLAPVSTEQIPIYNVTFEPACRNNWHIHHAKSGGGQMLICIGGRGWYQEYGKEARELNPGDIVNIPAEVKHWHGAAKDSWFAHLAVEISGEDASTEWCEAVSDDDYNKLK
jgi:4-carboxymuconolactone decarboxylase